MHCDFMQRDYFSSEKRGAKFMRIVGMVFVGVVFAVLFALGFGFLVKWIWNALMPELFGLKAITYWQAFGMVVLAKILFGAFGSHHHDRAKRHPSPFDCKGGSKGLEDEAAWASKGENGQLYEQFWHEEGKAAFEAYLKRKAEGEESV